MKMMKNVRNNWVKIHVRCKNEKVIALENSAQNHNSSSNKDNEMDFASTINTMQALD